AGGAMICERDDRLTTTSDLHRTGHDPARHELTAGRRDGWSVEHGTLAIALRGHAERRAEERRRRGGSEAVGVRARDRGHSLVVRERERRASLLGGPPW